MYSLSLRGNKCYRYRNTAVYIAYKQNPTHAHLIGSRKLGEKLPPWKPAGRIPDLTARVTQYLRTRHTEETIHAKSSTPLHLETG